MDDDKAERALQLALILLVSFLVSVGLSVAMR
jgi:hypothetical protein